MCGRWTLVLSHHAIHSQSYDDTFDPTLETYMGPARGSTSPKSDANHLADVQALRAEILQLKRELHALSPVRSIPLELLGEIFSSIFAQGHSKGI
jgi:hypothetical protein